MVDESSLTKYIIKEYKEGYSFENIKSILLKNNYDEDLVESSLKKAKKIIKGEKLNLNIKERNPVWVLILPFITFGIYYFYWLSKTTDELKENTGKAPSKWLLFILFIPGIHLFFFWKYSKAFSKLTGIDNIVIFILMAFTYPSMFYISMMVCQIELNKVSSKYLIE